MEGVIKLERRGEVGTELVTEAANTEDGLDHTEIAEAYSAVNKSMDVEVVETETQSGDKQYELQATAHHRDDDDDAEQDWLSTFAKPSFATSAAPAPGNVEKPEAPL